MADQSHAMPAWAIPQVWWDLVDLPVPLSAEDVARIAADVDEDDLDDADWFAVGPMLSRWPR